ncbi:exosome complex component RRP46-like [Tetranychus urticae]|uniref:Uncharacterized protein n=1 Tax=Tetranychus urticae TaxID=32264 RepID=T1L0C1_TETUR|nr:exosome complex component RRP46-like [Tetranychus urticae]
MAPKLRDLIITYNNLANPDGSALFCQGNTIVQTFVFGPVDVSSKEQSEKASLFVAFKPKNSCNKNDLRKELYENYIRTVLETIIHLDIHPRTRISVILQEMQDDGCLLSAAVNSACCALLDAGIPMKCMIASVTSCISVDAIQLDPNKEASQKSDGSIVLTFESSKNSIISVSSEGEFTVDNINEAIKLGCLATKKIYDFYHESMKKRFLINS